MRVRRITFNSLHARSSNGEKLNCMCCEQKRCLEIISFHFAGIPTYKLKYDIKYSFFQLFLFTKSKMETSKTALLCSTDGKHFRQFEWTKCGEMEEDLKHCNIAFNTFVHLELMIWWLYVTCFLNAFPTRTSLDWMIAIIIIIYSDVIQ